MKEHKLTLIQLIVIVIVGMAIIAAMIIKMITSNLNTLKTSNVQNDVNEYYNTYQDQDFSSTLIKNKELKEDSNTEYEEYSSVNKDIKHNIEFSTRDIMEKVITKNEREKINKLFADKIDEYLRDKKEYDEESIEEAKKYIIADYMLSMDSYNVTIYANNDKKLVFIININNYFFNNDNIEIETDISIDELLNSNPNMDDTNNEELEVLKPRVLDYSITDFINDEKYSSSDDRYDYVYNDDVLPEKVWDLYGEYMPIPGLGDSMGRDFIWHSATSTLVDGKFDYSASNLSNEFDKNNSWVEGVEGYGIGEKITVYTARLSELVLGNMIEGYYQKNGSSGNSIKMKEPYYNKLLGILIVNGYPKNEELYKANSRVKKMKLTIDDDKEYMIELEDTAKPQLFDVDYKTIYTKEKFYPIKCEFEILEVYEGEKYEDTAINTLLTGIDTNFIIGGR